MPLGSIAFRASLLSLLFGILTVILTYKMTRYALSTLKVSRITVLALLSCVTIFSSFTFLLYANVQEVYMLSLFFLASASYYLLRLYIDGHETDHVRFWLFGIMGIFHHYIVALSLGIYVALFWKKRAKPLLFIETHIPLMLFFAVLGIAPYITWYLLTSSDARLYWEEHTWWGLVRNILRLQYGIINTGAGFQSVASKLGNVVVYVQHLWLHYTVLILLVLPAFLYLFLRSKKLFLFFLFNAVAYGPLLVFYIDANLRLHNALGIIERYYLLSYLFLPPLIAIGYLALESYIARISFIRSPFARTLLLNGFLVIVMIVTPLLLLIRSSTALVRLLSYPIFETHARNLLAIAPKNAVLIMSGDVDLFPMQYVRYVKGYRKDITLLPSGPMEIKDYAHMLSKLPALEYTVSTDSAFFSSFISTMLNNKRPVFTNIPNPPEGFSYRQYITYVSIIPKQDEGKLRIVSPPIDILSGLALPLKGESTIGGVYPLYFYRVIQERYSRALFDSAETYFAKNDFTQTVSILDKAYQLNNNDDDIVSLYALGLIKIKKCADAEEVLLDYYASSRSAKAAFALSRLYATCIQNQDRFSYWNAVYEKAAEAQ